jgi:hypothetical protein
MAIKPRTERRFDGTSPVGRYWLAQCEGFHVKGSTSGTVERVVGSVDPQNPEALVVRTAWGRRNVPVTAVDTVVPAARLIVVEGDARSVTARTVAAKVARKAPPVAGFALDAVRALVLLAGAALVTLVRILRTVLLRCGQLAVTVGARLRSHVRARRQAAIERHASAARARATVSRDGRKISRAAVLRLGRDGDRERTKTRA